MTDDQLVGYIKTLQEAVRDLQKETKLHHQSILDLWGAQSELLQLFTDQIKSDNERFNAQINILLLFMTVRLSTSSEFASFLADLVEANKDAQGNNTIHETAKGLLDAGLNQYLPASAAPSQARARPLPDNVIIFPVKPSSPPSITPNPSQTPEE